LLQGFLLGLWSRAAEAVHRLAGRSPARSEALVRAAIEPTSQAPTLSSEEIGSLLALGEAVVEGRALSPDERRYLTEHIEDWARHIPGQLAYYRTAASLLDRLAAKPFSSLAIGDRIRLISLHRLDARSVPVGQDPEAIAAEARMVRSRVVPALIEGYWSSPAGWAAVGYQIFPGRCGELVRYTRPEV
jgi:hypothetical protein